MKQRDRKVGPITPAQFITQHILRMTTVEVAEELGVNQSAVSRYVSFPERHRKAIERLAKARKVKIKPEWHTKVPFSDDVPD